MNQFQSMNKILIIFVLTSSFKPSHQLSNDSTNETQNGPSGKLVELYVSCRKMEKLANISSVTYVDQTKAKPTGALLLLHGSCGSGIDFFERVRDLLGENMLFPHIKIVFPTATPTAYSPLGGAKTTTWFDVSDYTMEASENIQDEELSSARLIRLIVEEIVLNGIPLNRIAIAGFSRGGGMSFHMGYRHLTGIAGVGVMSSFLPYSSLVYKHLRTVKGITLPKLLQQHGTKDLLVNEKVANETFAILQTLQVEGSYISYPGMGHEVTKEELEALYKFVNSVIPDNVN